MFPRHVVRIVDEQNRLIDYRLFENEAEARRAFKSWRVVDGCCRWRPKGAAQHEFPWWRTFDEEISYDRSDLEIRTDKLVLDTFYKLAEKSDDELGLERLGYDVEVIEAARFHESQALGEALSE